MQINVHKMDALIVESRMNTLEFAQKAGLSRQTLSTIRGRKTAAPETVYKIASALGINVIELLEQEA